LYSGSNKQLDEWIEQIRETCDETDFNILAMKFNRKGAYIAFECMHLPKLNAGSSYMRYHGAKYGPWIITEFNSFWETNSKKIKLLCGE
jgi:hypothetical protein